MEILYIDQKMILDQVKARLDHSDDRELERIAQGLPGLITAVEEELYQVGSAARFVSKPTLRARAKITTHSWTPIHPVWLRCSSVIYLDIIHFSRLARRAPRRPRMGIYSCPDPKSSEHAFFQREQRLATPPG